MSIYTHPGEYRPRILRAVLELPGPSRAEVAKTSGILLGTVNNNVASLVYEEFIAERRSSMGRGNPAALLAANRFWDLLDIQIKTVESELGAEERSLYDQGIALRGEMAADPVTPETPLESISRQANYLGRTSMLAQLTPIMDQNPTGIFVGQEGWNLLITAQTLSAQDPRAESH
jgi:hypothetical protein